MLLLKICISLNPFILLAFNVTVLLILSRHSGIHLQSQTAYDLAVKGLIRPANDKIPTVYGIKCVDFERPMFTIGKFSNFGCVTSSLQHVSYPCSCISEVTCLNETEDYLLNIIHTIGIKVRSTARCNGIKCIRYGPFTLDHSLLQHSWNVENFVKNIDQCNAVNDVDLKSGRRENIKLTPLGSIEDSLKTDVSEVKNLGRLNMHQERRRLKRLRAEDTLNTTEE